MKRERTGPRYFYDTYALVEVFKGNPGYERFVIEKDGATSRFNLMELLRAQLKVIGALEAEDNFDALLPFTVEFEDDDIKDAVRMKGKAPDLSYIDCLGYCAARRLGLRFLTGDKEFADHKNVEFVK